MYDALILPTGEKHHLVFTERKSVIKAISVHIERRPPRYEYCHLSEGGHAQPGISLCQRASSWENISAHYISSRIKVCVEMDAAVTPCVCYGLVSEGHQLLKTTQLQQLIDRASV